MSNTDKKFKVALSSVFASFGLTVAKLIVGLLTGSIGILSEAAHSALDLGAALLTLFAVRVGDKPADKTHPFGHAKVESVSALIETGLLFLTSAWIIYEAINRLISKSVEIETTWYAFAVIIFSIIVDYSRSRALTRVAKATNSQALEADALHFSSDILSSSVVLLGLVFVSFGFKTADAFAAIGVSLFVLHAGYSLGKRTIDVLVDTAPEGITDKITAITKKVEGVIGIEKIRTRPVGASIFVDMVVTVSRKLPLEQVQGIIKAIELQTRKIFPETDLTIHTKPLSLDTETIIERIQIIAVNQNLSVHDIVVHTQNNKKYISFDLEVKSQSTIKKAHEIASNLESVIKKEIADDIEISTHIEPIKSDIILGKNVNAAEEGKIKEGIMKVVKKLPLVKEVHGVQIRKAQDKLFISLHCLFNDNTSLEDVHTNASRFEYLLREEIPDIQRVVVHAEPIILNA